MMVGQALESTLEPGLTVLLLERDEAVRSVVALGLALRKFQVLQAATARDAKTTCLQNPFHLLLADVNSLDEEALETVRAIKAGQPETAVLLLSVFDKWTVASQYVGLLVGNEFLQKPFSLDLLITVMQKLPLTRGSVRQDQRDVFAASGKGASAMRGVVKWFNDGKGYGFIGRADGTDVFCHYTAIQMGGHKTLREGEEVEFEIVQGDKGPQAGQVFKVKRDDK